MSQAVETKSIDYKVKDISLPNGAEKKFIWLKLRCPV